MKAIAYRQNGLPISDPHALVDLELPAPTPGPRDLLVAVQAISVNPVDTKIRRGVAVTEPRVLGWDAVGIVQAVGSDVSLFKAGDAVYYAGDLTRPGSNSELHLVDERIAALKPKTLDNAHAAALPLTSITAWELLFERLAIQEGGGEGQSLLIIGAAGGVGSILTQLARQLTRMTVIGSASRPETQAWVEQLGAHQVIDHSRSIPEELARIGVGQVTHVISLTHTDTRFAELVEALKPQGHLALIDDPQTLDVTPMKRKSLSLHWELMFTRSMYQTDDMIEQHRLLTRVAELVDSGVLKTTLGEHYGTINAANLRRAHALIESGKAQGKIVLEGF